MAISEIQEHTDLRNGDRDVMPLSDIRNGDGDLRNGDPRCSTLPSLPKSQDSFSFPCLILERDIAIFTLLWVSHSRRLKRRMVEVVMLFIQLLRPVRDEAAETNTELRHSGEFLMAVTFSTLGAVVQARQNGGGTGADPHQLLLGISSIAILLSLASSILHLGRHCQLCLPLARLFLHLAAFFTASAVVLLIASSISPSLCWVPFAVFFSTLIFLGYFKLFPAILHHVAVLHHWRFVVFLIGPADMQSSNNQLSPTSMDHEHREHLHGEISETAAPKDQLELFIPE